MAAKEIRKDANLGSNIRKEGPSINGAKVSGLPFGSILGFRLIRFRGFEKLKGTLPRFQFIYRYLLDLNTLRSFVVVPEVVL